MRISEDLVTNRYWCDFEAPGMFLAQRNAATKKAKFDRVSANSRTRMFDLCSLDQTKHHQALDLGVRGIDRPNDAPLAASESRECVAVDSHDRL
jgi:hypothetical protein